MTAALSKAKVEELIGTLDPVLPHDPPMMWRPACELLQRELNAAAKIDHSLRVVGPTLACAAFLAFEGSRLTLAAAGPLSLIGVCVLTTAFASDAKARRYAAAFIVPLVFWLAALVTYISGYVVLALTTNIAVGYLLEKFYPALEYRDRITFLIAYFGFDTWAPDAAS